MTDKRQEQAAAELTLEKEALDTVAALNFLLEVQAPMTPPRADSLSIKNKGDSMILTMKRRSGEGPQVCFVMSNAGDKVIRKAAAFYKKDKLGWRRDEWAVARFDDDEENW